MRRHYLAFPSTANYIQLINGSGHTSKMSGHGQLQTLSEELAEDPPRVNGKSMLSPEPSPLHSHHVAATRAQVKVVAEVILCKSH